MTQRKAWRILAVLAIIFVLSVAASAAETCIEHDYQWIDEPPTCIESGYSGYRCRICRQNKDFENIQPLGHDFGEWITVSQGTCSGNGSEMRSCSRCTYEEVRSTDQTGHTYTVSVVSPTCTSNGYTLHKCDICGHEERTDTVTKYGHTYTTSIIEPTCSKEGYTLKSCTVCGHEEKTNYVSKIDHTLTVWVQTATCKSDGYTRYSCTVCSYEEKTDQVKAIGHQYEETVVEPTCTADGYTRYACANCGDAYRTDQTQKTGHHYNNGIITKEPTWTTMGRKTFTCLGCGDSYTQTTPKLSNPFVDVNAKQYYFDSVVWAVGMEISTGIDDTHFAPDASCTRGQVVTFLWREAGRPAPQSTVCPFTDVLPGAYYYDAVLWAVEQGITNGVDNTHFAPNQSCTRCQVVTFLHRAKGKPVSTSSIHFTDVKTQDYFYTAVCWATSKGITNGTGGTTFSPHNSCTRAQIVTFLYRAKG